MLCILCKINIRMFILEKNPIFCVFFSRLVLILGKTIMKLGREDQVLLLISVVTMSKFLYLSELRVFSCKIGGVILILIVELAGRITQDAAGQSLSDR